MKETVPNGTGVVCPASEYIFITYPAPKAGGIKSISLDKLSRGESLSPQGKAKLKAALSSAEKQYKKHNEIKKGMFAGADIAIVLSFKKAMKQLEIAEKTKVTTTKRATTSIAALWAGAGAVIQTVGAWAVTWGTRMLGALGWVSLIATGVFMLADAFGFKLIPEMTEAEKETQRLTERFKELNSQYKDFIQKQLDAAGAGKRLQGLGAIGEQIGMMTPEDLQRGAQAYLAYVEAQERASKRAAARSALGGRGRKGRQAPISAAEAKQRSIDKEILAEGSFESESTKFFERQLVLIEELQDQYGISAKAFDDYAAAVKDGKTGPELAEAAKNSMELANSITNLPRLMSESNQATQAFVNSLSPLNQAEQTIKALEEEIKEFAKVYAGTGEIDQSRFNELTRRAKLFRQLNETIFNLQQKTTKDKIAQIEASRTQSEYARDLANVTNSIQDTQNSMALKEQEIANIRALALEEERDLTPQQKRTIERLQEEIKLEEANLAILNDQEVIEKKILGYKKQLFEQKIVDRELSAQKEINDLASKELRIRQDLLAIREQRGKMAVDRELRTEKRSNIFAFLDEDQRRANRAVDLEKSLIQDRLEATKQEFDLKRDQIDLEYALLDAKLETTKAEIASRAESIRDENPEEAARLDSVVSKLSAVQGKIGGMRTSALKLLDEQEQFAIEKIFDNLDKLEFAKEQLMDITKLGNAIGTSVASNLGTAFNSIIQGTSSVKDAFKNMALNILQSISQVIAQMIAMRVLMALFNPFGSVSPSMGMTDTVNPAMFSQMGMTARYGGMFEGYSQGGIARGRDAGYPAILHGTEAVVPLPNGNKIPVEMMNGSGQNNNVTVNVSVDNQGKANSSSQQDSNQAGNLGKAIAKAVQTELQNQKRSGGILNPYGVA